jgi:hypothetical protein
MTSEVDICNLALTESFCSEIQSLTAQSREAEVCNRFYAQCRDLLLSGYNWKFNQVRRSLSVSSETPPNDWGYAYEVPTNCLYAVKIFQSNRNPVKEIPFTIESKLNVDEKILYTDEPDAILIYRKKITVTNMFSPMFIEAFANLLGAKVAMGLKQDINLANIRMTSFWQAVSRGTILDSAARDEDAQPDTELVTSRL